MRVVFSLLAVTGSALHNHYSLRVDAKISPSLRPQDITTYSLLLQSRRIGRLLFVLNCKFLLAPDIKPFSNLVVAEQPLPTSRHLFSSLLRSAFVLPSFLLFPNFGTRHNHSRRLFLLSTSPYKVPSLYVLSLSSDSARIISRHSLSQQSIRPPPRW